MNENEITLKELLYDEGYRDYFTKQLFSYKNIEKSEMLKLINEIKENKFSTFKEGGNALEKLIGLVFNAKNCFKIYKSVRTSSNEIDLVIEILPSGISLNVHSILGCEEKKILIECKNHNKKIDVTWVGKFANLLNTHNIDYGIIFSKLPLTGLKNNSLTWNDAAGLTKKFYLKYSKSILNITLDELEKILLSDINFVEFLNYKKMSIQLDTTFQLPLHENSEKDIYCS